MLLVAANRNQAEWRLLTFAAALIISSISVTSTPALVKPAQQQMTATFQTFNDEIKRSCKRAFENDEAKFRSCAKEKYTAMRGFFEKLFYHRDNAGIASKEFKAGTDCLNRHAPEVNQPERKYAIERTDWIRANSCYEKSLQTRK